MLWWLEASHPVTMAFSGKAVHQLLTNNSKDDFLAASELLLRLANNILENPNDVKYRRIRVGNPLIQSKLLPVVGGMECLFDMGFLEDGEYLTLPANNNLRAVQQIRDEISVLCQRVRRAEDDSSANGPSRQRQEEPFMPGLAQSVEVSQQSTMAAAASSLSAMPATPSTSSFSAISSTLSSSATPTAQASSVAAGVPEQEQRTQTSGDLRRSESSFFARLQSGMSQVLLYEDPLLQDKARALVPTAKLMQEAEIRLQECRSEDPSSLLDVKDCLVLELLNWFKKSFFIWVDCLPCEKCGGSTHHAGSTVPTDEEALWGGSRVEKHQCDTCSAFTRFPRYNHPAKLLETRRGRCGEWANCFTLCCRALRFEARYVLDWTDHVWTEVYSQSQKRWMHCDPCENVCDKPLLYEEGWGKKLTYVIGFSKDDIQDVTWRYSAKHQEVLARRNSCRESWLINTIHELFNKMLQTMSEARKQEMLHRLVVELVEFMTPKTAVNQSLQGRTTGSLAWRLARGELGTPEPAKKSEYVFRLLEEEKHSERVYIKYSCAKDIYIRESQSGATRHWYSCTYNTRFIFRKEESDWKMVYLAREDNSSSAEISWKFDLSGEDLCISRLELQAPSATYENGVVSWRLCADGQCFTVPGPQLNNFQSFDLHRSQTLVLTAVLTGGRGDVAWQHAQLFRQGVDDAEFPFQIVLHLS